MGGTSIILRQKQEFNMRTRWTAALDQIFVDLVVEQIQLGNKPNNFFDKKTWNYIREEFNKQTALDFNNNQLRKHLEVLRARFLVLKSATYQNDDDFVFDDSCSIGFGIWDNDFKAQPRLEPTKIKDCPIFEQLCTIFSEPETEGKYAQSSHYEELDKSLLSTNDLLVIPLANSEKYPQAYPPLSSMFDTPCATSAQPASKSIQEKRDQDLNEIMAKSMLDMLNASTLRRSLKPKQNEKFSITNCVEGLDKIEAEEGMNDSLYFAALDLFDDPNMRETFVSLKSNKIRLAWLLGKRANKKPRLS